MKKTEQFKAELNTYGQSRTPILFVIDFGMDHFYVSPLDSLPSHIRYSIDQDQWSQAIHDSSLHDKLQISRPQKPWGKYKPYTYQAVSKGRYKKAFDTIISQIEAGNTYLTNLTFPSKLFIDYSLEEIYEYSDARFKLLFGDQFVTFSPERFVNIKDNKIFTYPMKGTIDTKIPNAKEKILSNKKEMAEHTMVVDLLRNDLSIVSRKVRVEKFRYVEKIKAGDRELLQVSSKIKGELEEGWQDRLGDIITALLPAGSITGTPKSSTVDIIKRVEGYDRGFYSGIFGVFDGEGMDSAVMIRFVERRGDQLYYKSGGGITIDSDWQSEYNEMCEKIYVPFL